MDNTTTEIVLTPNYEQIFRVMLRDALLRGKAQRMFDSLTLVERAYCLRQVQAFLAPLNVAAQSMTTAEAVDQFRDAIHQINSEIDRTAFALEEKAGEWDWKWESQ